MASIFVLLVVFLSAGTEDESGWEGPLNWGDSHPDSNVVPGVRNIVKHTEGFHIITFAIPYNVYCMCQSQ